MKITISIYDTTDEPLPVSVKRITIINIIIIY